MFLDNFNLFIVIFLFKFYKLNFFINNNNINYKYSIYFK